MASSTELTVARRRSPLVTMPTAEDRDAAFRRARNHSRRVRFMRVAFPVIAVALFATYGISVKYTITDNAGGTLQFHIPTLIGEDLTMNNPEYQGYNKDGSRFVVQAQTARQDIRQTGPVRLELVKARITQPDNTVTVVDARRGDYETKSGVLKAFDGIDIVSQNGLRARLATATVQTKEGLVVSNDPVLVTMPTGEVRGNRMELRQKVRQVTFFDGVAARLVPEQRQKPDAARSEQNAMLLGNSNAPVDVLSERLDLDDAKKVAVFRGAVKAVQGEATLVAPELEVHYDNAQPPGATGSGGQTAPDGQPVQGRLNRMIARTDITLTRGADVVLAREAVFEAATNTATLLGGVLITSPPDRRATGDRADIDTAASRIRLSGKVQLSAGTDRQATAELADIDQKTDVAVLTGKAVVVTQGQNTLRGRRLTIDRKAGTSEMLAPGDRVTAHFVRPRSDQPVRNDRPAASSFGGVNFSTDPNAPIDLEADGLLVNDPAKTATFRGDVRAVQGDFVVRTPELVATYTGQASMADAATQGAPQASPRPADGEPAQLQTLRANRKVLITSRDSQSVTGDWAVFDVKANTVTVGGDVVITQGRNVIRGPRLVIDMVTGQSRMEQIWGGMDEAAARPPQNGGAVAAPRSVTGGRVGAVFYPQELKELKEKRAREAGQDDADQRKPAAAPAGKAATSGWNVDTRPAASSD